MAGASLGALSPAELKRSAQVFLIVSSARDGELPEPAGTFHERLQGADLKGLRFALLALGESSHRQFCAGGLTLRAALLQTGAEELLPVVKADRNPARQWRRWLAEVAGH